MSRRNRRLHALGTVHDPDKSLSMLKESWEALHAATGPIEVIAWSCGDHGADVQMNLRLSWTSEGIVRTRRTLACTPDDKPSGVLSEEPL